MAQKEYSFEMAAKIFQRIGELGAADSVETLLKYQVGRCHSLKGNRKGQFAMDLVQPFRLIFEKSGDKIQIAKVLKIENYH